MLSTARCCPMTLTRSCGWPVVTTELKARQTIRFRRGGAGVGDRRAVRGLVGVSDGVEPHRGCRPRRQQR